VRDLAKAGAEVDLENMSPEDLTALKKNLEAV
jgi:hypothetical protein